MVERICEVENHQQNVDASCGDFVISEKAVECTERTEWAQALNLEAHSKLKDSWFILKAVYGDDLLTV